MEAARIKPDSSNKFNIVIALSIMLALFFLVNSKLAFSQSAQEVGYTGNNIAAVYSTDQSGTPMDIKVYQNYPNPFSTSTTIKFETAAFSNLKLAIYDQNGNLVKAYLYDNIQPGLHEVNIDGTDFPAGEYTYRFISGNYSQTYKMNLVK
jgi:hypothetical protein